tara:strand:+ start:3161 stop:3577 length:417 start_codon:yes stop_codon:yes gene_type:complete
MKWTMPFALFLQGCSFAPRTNTSATNAIDALGSITAAGPGDPCGSLAILSWVGGLAIIGGIAALVITRTYGIKAIVIGVGLVLLNYAVSRYAHAIFVPMLIGTGLISMAYAFVVVRNALKTKTKQKSLEEEAMALSRR